jgi:hypothetical protein
MSERSSFYANPQDNQSQGISVIKMPTDQSDIVVSNGETDGDMTIMYQSASAYAPDAGFLIEIAEIEGGNIQTVHRYESDMELRRI